MSLTYMCEQSMITDGVRRPVSERDAVRSQVIDVVAYLRTLPVRGAQHIRGPFGGGFS